MRATCLALVFLLLIFSPVEAGHSAPRIQLRVHVQTTGEGLPNMEATTISLPPSGEQIQVRTLPEATEQELIDVRQDSSGTLHLQFNHVGQVALSAVTAQNQGRILVVFLNGVIIYAPIIDVQITSGELDIPHPIRADVLALLVETAQRNVRQAAKS